VSLVGGGGPSDLAPRGTPDCSHLPSRGPLGAPDGACAYGCKPLSDTKNLRLAGRTLGVDGRARPGRHLSVEVSSTVIMTGTMQRPLILVMWKVPATTLRRL